MANRPPHTKATSSAANKVQNVVTRASQVLGADEGEKRVGRSGSTEGHAKPQVRVRRPPSSSKQEKRTQARLV